MAYYSEINTQKLISSPQFTETFDYKKTIEGEVTEEKLSEYGVYILDGALMKNFPMTIDGNVVNVQWRMYTDKIVGTDNYTLGTRGVALDRDLEDFIKSATNAYGYDIEDPMELKVNMKQDLISKYTGSDLDVERMVIKGVIDVYGRSSFDYRLMDIVHNYLESQPITENPYKPVQTPLPVGENFITDYDHTNFINNNIAHNLSHGLTPKQFESSIKNLLETDDEFKSIMDNSQVVRIWYATQRFPSDNRIYVNGYTLNNASIVASNEDGNNQHYGGMVTHVKGILLQTNSYDYADYPALHKTSSWESDINNYGITLFNYPKSDWYNLYGFTTGNYGGGGVITTGYCIDSVGNTVTPQSIQPFSDNHSRWYPQNDDEPYQPVGYDPTTGTKPTINIQNIIIKGGTPIIIRPNPIEGDTPIPPIDDSQEDTIDDLPHEPFLCGNAYHPMINAETGKHELDLFYEWLWDRDTWHEKQEMNNDPLEAVISLHSLPLPDNEEYEDFKWYDEFDRYPLALGFLEAKEIGTDESIKSFLVNRFVEFKFGSVEIPRTYRDFRDYNREIYIYLPYIGFRQLRCDDVTPYKGYSTSKINLSYMIDTYTGDFVARITINKQNALQDKDRFLYEFNGNMAIHIPINATDKSRLQNTRAIAMGGVGATALGATSILLGLSGVGLPISLAASVGMFGGGIATILKSLYDNANQNMATVERSGSLSSTFGALSPRTPFVVVNSPIAYDTNYQPFAGDSANVVVQLGQLKGYTRCRAVHVDTMSGITEEERIEIEKILTNGVIL